MSRTFLISVAATLTIIISLFIFTGKNLFKKTKRKRIGEVRSTVALPPALYSGELSIEEALSKRRSLRHYKPGSLQLKEISQLLWAAQGITGEENKKTAPSAGALYPLEIYVLAANVEGLVPGVYHYLPVDHSLLQIAEGDKRIQLSAAALMQPVIRDCAAVLIFAGNYNRSTNKYFERGKRYVHIETGHSAQNVFLQAVPLQIGTVTVGAFADRLVKKVLELPQNEEPIYLMPLGKI